MSTPAMLAPATASRGLMHVIARVGTERFAFRVADVEEVVDAPKLVATPTAPDGLAGQVVYREQTLRAYDAAWAFGIARAPDARAGTALVLRVADDRAVLLVDDVEDLTALDPDSVRTTPPGTDPEGLLTGVCLPPRDGNAALVGVVNTGAVVARMSALRAITSHATGAHA